MRGKEGGPTPPEKEPFDFQAWAEDEYPPVVNPVEDASELTAEDAEKARHYLTSFWTTKLEPKKQPTLYKYKLEELSRLDYMFPDVHDEVMKQVTAIDVDKWREKRKSFQSLLSEERLERLKRGYPDSDKWSRRKWPWRK